MFSYVKAVNFYPDGRISEIHFGDGLMVEDIVNTIGELRAHIEVVAPAPSAPVDDQPPQPWIGVIYAYWDNGNVFFERKDGTRFLAVEQDREARRILSNWMDKRTALEVKGIRLVGLPILAQADFKPAKAF